MLRSPWSAYFYWGRERNEQHRLKIHSAGKARGASHTDKSKLCPQLIQKLNPPRSAPHLGQVDELEFNWDGGAGAGEAPKSGEIVADGGGDVTGGNDGGGTACCG